MSIINNNYYCCARGYSMSMRGNNQCTCTKTSESMYTSAFRGLPIVIRLLTMLMLILMMIKMMMVMVVVVTEAVVAMVVVVVVVVVIVKKKKKEELRLKKKKKDSRKQGLIGGILRAI